MGREAPKGNKGKGTMHTCPSPSIPPRPHLKLLGWGSEKMMLSHISPRTGRFNSLNENSENSAFVSKHGWESFY